MSYTYLCENFTCSPGQEAESLAELSSDTPQFALWKLSHTADASCSKDSATESCHDSRYGTTSPHFPPPLGADELTSCVEGFPAKTFPPPEKAQESKAREADCGGTWPEWFAKFDPVSCSWKTRQCSLLAGLDVFSGTWPRWGMMRSGVCWGLTTPGHRTGENESGFGENWPTPDARDAQPEGLAAGVRRMEKYSTCGLQTAVALWPTPDTCAGGTGPSQVKRNQPRLQDVVTWATPAARDHKGTTITQNYPEGFNQSLPNQVGGQLNPNWVEWLMGWPIGWTDLKPLATDRCHNAPLSHGAHSQDSNQ